MTIDTKVIEEKIKTNKPLTKEEETAILQDQGAVDGYANTVVQDMDVVEFDESNETKPAKSEIKPVEDETKPTADKTPVKKEIEPVKTDETVKPETVGTKEDFFVKLERELSKPEGQEDLKNFSDREKAYFHQMKRDRKNRQRAEEERDQALFRETQLKAKLTEKPKEEEVDPVADLKKRNPTDYLTVAEVIALTEKISKKQETKKEEISVRPSIDPRQMNYLKLCEKEAREAHTEDFDAVMELTEDIINNNPKHLIEVAKALNAGENPALKAYELIKADPEFAKLFPVAKTKIEARAAVITPEKVKVEEKPAKSAVDSEKAQRVQKAEAALDKNQTKTKTTGHVESSATNSGTEPSFEDISKMSDREFARLPKKTRQKYLEQMKDL